MKVVELENKGLKRSFKITVEAAQINNEVEAELKRAGEQVKIPGFRPGFIPMKVLKQRYGKSVQADVVKTVISHTTHDALVERKLRPAVTPDVNVDSYEEDGDLTYTVSCEVIPEIPEMKFDGLTLERKTFEVAESDVDEASARIAKRSPKLAPAKDGAKAEMGQVVTIDFKGMKDGVAFDGGSAEDFKLELGSKRFIEGFEEQLVGAKAGDKLDVKVTFPQDYPAKDLAGAKVVFAVTVKAIEVLETPEIDETFAKARGFGDLAAFREAVRTQLVKEYDMAVRRDLKKQLFDSLEGECHFELPQSMVDMEFNSIWGRLQEAKAQGDESVLDKSDDELKEEYMAIAKRRVKLGLLLAEIGLKNKIEITNEELNRAVMQQASQFPGQEKKVFEFYRNNQDQLGALRGPILEEKAVDFILSKVKYNDKKTTLKALDEADAEENAPEKSEKKPASKPSKPKAKKKSEE